MVGFFCNGLLYEIYEIPWFGEEINISKRCICCEELYFDVIVILSSIFYGMNRRDSLQRVIWIVR